MPCKIAAGNWKMNGLSADLAEVQALAATQPDPGCDVIICPPATLVAALAAACVGGSVNVGAQDCHSQKSGAHTGEISAEQLADAGASHIIVGHSERRADHCEPDTIVAEKNRSRMARWTCRHSLRWRDRGRARCRSDTGSRAPTDCRFATGRRECRKHDPGLRAGLGHRNRAHRDACGNCRNTCRHSRHAVRSTGRGGR